MADVLETSINKEMDIGVIFNFAEQALANKEYKRAIKITEKGLMESKASNLTMWEQRFDKLNSKVKEVHLTVQLKSVLKRAQQEEEIYQYETALEFYNKSLPLLNSLFKLGKNQEKVKRQMTKSMKKINDIKVKIKNAPEEVLEAEVEETYEPKPMKDPADFILTLNPGTSIVIDGSNVAWNQGDKKEGDKPELRILLRVWKTLENLGFKNVITFCDYSLLKQIDDRKQLEKLMKNGKIISWKRRKEADNIVLRYAKRKDGYIVVARERFRDWHNVYGEEWINERRIEVDLINNEVFFDPEIKVEALSNLTQDIDEIGEQMFYGEPEMVLQEEKKPVSFPPKRMTEESKSEFEPEEITYKSSAIKEFLNEDTPDNTMPEKPKTHIGGIKSAKDKQEGNFKLY